MATASRPCLPRRAARPGGPALLHQLGLAALRAPRRMEAEGTCDYLDQVEDVGMSERAVLAGACFWGMQELIRHKPGVDRHRVGYTGGDVTERDLTATTAPMPRDREPLRPEVSATARSLNSFFQNKPGGWVYDPTTPNRQGNDRGPSYRSAIY